MGQHHRWKLLMALPKKSMKGIKTWAGRRSMKARKSKIARGIMAKSLVLKGKRVKTSGGLTKDALIKNKNGKVVSKKKSSLAKRRWATSALKRWIEAVKVARKALNITGFVAVNGKTAQGKALYAKAKTLYSA